VKYEVCVGVDVCAYGTQTFEADSDEAAIAKARDIAENNMPVLHPRWGSQENDRIVFVRKGDEVSGEWIAENIELYPDPLHDNAFRLLQAARDVLVWAAELGGWEAPCWTELLAAVDACGGKLEGSET
jgi:hypothetical protein